jgi:phospholipase C
VRFSSVVVQGIVVLPKCSAFVPFVVAVALAGCGGSHGLSSPELGGAPLTPFSKKVSVNTHNQPQHVVIVVQENRSFDNLFQKFPGADTQSYGLDLKNDKIPLRQIELGATGDPEHSHSAFVTEFNDGLDNGFAEERCAHSCGHLGAYTYVNPADVAQYYAMGEQYAIADHNLQPNEGPSFPAHLYLVAAQSGTPDSNWYVAENPGTGHGKEARNCLAPPHVNVEQIDMTSAFPGTEGDPIFPCVDPPTIIKELASAGFTWKYYTPSLGSIWTAPCAISSFNCASNPNVVVPETSVLNDIANGQLATVSWVIPADINSDHPGPHGDAGGPAWVSSVVDAIGESSYWSNTAIFVVWDDWGGWYDHYIAGNNHPASNPQDPYEYGFRVPLLAIGPYVRPGYISHTPRDSTSIVHFLEDNFGIPSLDKLDLQTDDLFELFDFSQTPNQFKPFDVGKMSIQQRRMMPRNPHAGPVDTD